MAPETTISLVFIKIFFGETPKPPWKGNIFPACPFLWCWRNTWKCPKICLAPRSKFSGSGSGYIHSFCKKKTQTWRVPIIGVWKGGSRNPKSKFQKDSNPKTKFQMGSKPKTKSKFERALNPKSKFQMALKSKIQISNGKNPKSEIAFHPPKNALYRKRKKEKA